MVAMMKKILCLVKLYRLSMIDYIKVIYSEISKIKIKIDLINKKLEGLVNKFKQIC